MPVAQLTLSSLLENAESLDARSFTAAHGGHFLVAMGRLSAEEIRARCATSEDGTLPVRVGDAHELGADHPLAGQVFQIPGPQRRRLRLGRSVGCDIQVPDESVSDLHCEIVASSRGLAVVDLGSTNGTSISGVKLVPGTLEPLGDGELLTVARYSFQVLSAGSLFTTLLELRGMPPGSAEAADR